MVLLFGRKYVVMEVMKHKLYIVGIVVLLAAVMVTILILSRGPAAAVDPAKDYSKAAMPSSQVLSDTYSQPTAVDAKKSALAPIPVPSTATSTKTSTSSATATQSTTTTPSTTVQKVTPVSNGATTTEIKVTTPPTIEKKDTKGAVKVLLQSISNLGI